MYSGALKINRDLLSRAEDTRNCFRFGGDSQFLFSCLNHYYAKTEESSSGFLNLTFLGVKDSEFCPDAGIVLFLVSFPLGADPSTACWPAGAPEQNRSHQPSPSSSSFQNKPWWEDLPP